MNSERHSVQLYIEEKIGCSSPDQLKSFKARFEDFSVGHSARSDLNDLVLSDGKSYYKKGILSLLQGLQGIDHGHETWGLIKLYYSIFCLQRARLAHDRIAFLRCVNIYTLKIAVGEKPVCKSGKAYQGDHKATIKIYSDEYGGSDIILSQSIENLNPFYWMSSKREWVNYKRKDFIDISGMKGFSREEEDFSIRVAQAVEDSVPILCFDPDYAALAMPVKFAQNCVSLLDPAKTQIDEIYDACPVSLRSSQSVSAFITRL